MIESQEVLAGKLREDVERIYSGFPRIIEPQDIPTLAELAEALSLTPCDGKDDYYRQAVEALIRRAIGRLRPADQPGVIELLGIDYPDELNIGVRLDHAAPHFGRKNGESLRHLEEHDEKVIHIRLYEDLVNQLVVLATEAKFEYQGRFEAADADVEDSPKTSRTATVWWRRPAIAGLVVAVLIAATSVVVIRPWGEAGVSTTTTELANLEAEAEHELVGDQAPPPGDDGRLLGFGDPTPQGRKVYPYVAHEKTPAQENTPVSATPALNVLTDAPHGIGDERRFLQIRTGKATLHYPDGVLRRSAYIRHHELVRLWFYIDNGAAPEPNCDKLVGPTIAKHTTARLSVWDSPDRHMHIIRAWIFAENANPTWITDAVAVVTEQARSLQLVPSLSSQVAELNGHATYSPLSSTSIVEPAGMELGNGLLGSCWTNRYLLFLTLK